MRTDSAAERVVLAFNDAINRQDLEALIGLMTNDHRFTDSAGNEATGVDAMREAWEGFFGSLPDYRNVIRETYADGTVVLLLGHSECSEPALRGPAIWRAVVRAGRVAVWEIHEDLPETRRKLRVPSTA